MEPPNLTPFLFTEITRKLYQTADHGIPFFSPPPIRTGKEEVRSRRLFGILRVVPLFF